MGNFEDLKPLSITKRQSDSKICYSFSLFALNNLFVGNNILTGEARTLNVKWGAVAVYFMVCL